MAKAACQSVFEIKYETKCLHDCETHCTNKYRLARRRIALHRALFALHGDLLVCTATNRFAQRKYRVAQTNNALHSRESLCTKIYCSAQPRIVLHKPNFRKFEIYDLRNQRNTRPELKKLDRISQRARHGFSDSKFAFLCF